MVSVNGHTRLHVMLLDNVLTKERVQYNTRISTEARTAFVTFKIIQLFLKNY